MKTTILYLAAALTAGISVAPATAQNADESFSNAPLTLEQEQVVSEIRKTDNHLYWHARGGIKKHLKDWTQADFRRFTQQYDDGRLSRLRLLRSGSGQATEPADIASITTAIFFWHLTLDGGGGDGAE